MDTPIIAGRDARFRHARPDGAAAVRPAPAAVRSTLPPDAVPSGRRPPRSQADLNLLVTLILMTAVLLALCVVLGGVAAPG